MKISKYQEISGGAKNKYLT